MGAVVLTLRYYDIMSYYVVTGEGKRKPALCFQHKPEGAKSAAEYLVYMDASDAKAAAKDLDDGFTAMADARSDGRKLGPQKILKHDPNNISKDFMGKKGTMYQNPMSGDAS